MKSDQVYFAERAKQERAAAMRAVSLSAREAHLELASRYDDLVNGMLAHDRQVGPEIAA
jgi:hypothetical protein